MLSLTAEYALRVTVLLGQRSGEVISRKEISVATQVPASYLVKVLAGMESAGILSSKKGPGGGYWLASSPAKLSVFDVLSAVSELPRIRTCPLGIAEHKRLCPLHARLDEVAEYAEKAFRDTKIQDLLPASAGKNKCRFPAPVKAD